MWIIPLEAIISHSTIALLSTYRISLCQEKKQWELSFDPSRFGTETDNKMISPPHLLTPREKKRMAKHMESYAAASRDISLGWPLAGHGSHVHGEATTITCMLPSCCSVLFFFSPFFLTEGFCDLCEVAKALPRSAVIPECQAAAFTVEDATCHLSLLAGLCLLWARLCWWLLPLPECYPYKCQHLFLTISCCFRLFTYHTAISHNPTKQRGEQNEAHIPIFPFLKATSTASFEFCR